MASRAPALFAALTALFYNGIPVTFACNFTAQSAQMSAMLALYDRDALPRPKVEVATKFDVRHATIDEGTQTLHVLADFRMYWNDSRLSWNATDTGCTWFLVDADQLWTPDVELVNAAATYESSEHLMARVSSTGAVTAVSRMDVALPVALQLDDWPNDLQTGDFQFASRAHGIDEIVLTDMDLRTRVHESGAWQLLNVEGFLSSLEGLSADDEERSLHKYRVNLQRRAPAQALAARVWLALLSAPQLDQGLEPHEEQGEGRTKLTSLTLF
ncbi:neurotransmitter-gated ion-channel ligand binding domain-containing protein [Phthorimaea operculella]|nr:neurotransmitter-gated ion-channel ligand binding domain-containing protein [Phthorimaea operculella]